MLKTNDVLTELNLSDCAYYTASPDGPGFARELAVGISGNGAISSINLLKNHIPVERAQELVKIMQAKKKLITLCGLSKEETELDFSNQRLGPGDAVLIANDISDMRAMSVLNLASNNLGELVLPGGWTKKGERFDGKRQYVFTHADGSKQIGHPGKPEGIIAIANAIPNMGALIKLDISSNGISSEQKGMIQRICAAGGIELAS
jgi:hypothetical protein